MLRLACVRSYSSSCIVSPTLRLRNTREFSVSNDVKTSAPPPRASPEDLKHVREQVKARDYEGFLCSQVISDPRSRQAVLALRAFNIEIASIKDSSKNDTARGMRFAWWRETLGSIYQGNPPAGQPVVMGLSDAVQDWKLNRGWFKRLLDAREKDIENRIPRSIEDLEDYAEKTYGSLYYLFMESCGVKDANADHAASHLGKAVGLVTILRGTPHHLRTRNVYLPLQLMTKHSISQEELFRGEPSPGLAEIAWEIASTAKVHLDHANDLRKTLPATAQPVLLSEIAVNSFLTKLQQCNFSICF